MATPEGKIKALIQRRMSQEFPESYRFMPVQNGMGAPSVDFLYCVHGLFVAIEAKAPGKWLTKRQEETLREVAAAGGECCVVDGPTSMDAVVGKLKCR